MTLQATGDSEPSAQLTGNTTIPFVDGWANFTNLMIDLNGTYILDFNVVYPAEASDFSIASQEVAVILKIVEGRIVEQPTSVTKDAAFSVIVDLLHTTTGNKIDNIAWRVIVFFTKS